MSVYVDDDHRIIVYDNDDKKEITTSATTSRINKGGEPPTATMEAEKRIRREIANSNERRRMQSINNGFQSLRSLLPHHEGEKLSKAAILQQTAEYIYSLEQEKTRLLSQNCQLKRLVSQHESSINNNNNNNNNNSNNNNSNNGELPPKKRKTEILLAPPPPPPAPSTTESSDEGLGSMSPEPIVAGGYTTVIESPAELRRQLERERNLRLVLEEQVRQFENQLFQQQQQQQQNTNQQQSPQIYHVDNGDDLTLQLVTAESLPPVGHTQTVVCSPPNSRSPSPEPLEQQRLPSVLENAIKAEPKVEVERLPSPNPGHDETITTTATTTTTGSGTTQNRLYVANTSRQNLETIVEAIRHLEGDHMFGDEPAVVTQQQQQHQQQEVPLALTKHPRMNRMEFSATIVQQSQQSRPGVIVVKQAS